MAGKLQNEDFKSKAELQAAGGNENQLLNDTKIYVTSNGINKTLDQAILDGDIGGGGVGGVDIMSSDIADRSKLADYTQTGLEIITTPVIVHGSKSFRLIHQAASTRSFKKTIAVDPKFRGKAHIFEMDVVSSALTANLNVLFRDETNNVSIQTASQITTGSQSISCTTTNASTSMTVNVSDFNKLKLGMLITGSGIPSGTTITGLSQATLTATLSNPATSSGSATRAISALTNRLSFGFYIPEGCLSFSWTISALQEAGAPETYIDDIIVELAQAASTTTTVTVPKNNNFKGRAYSPVFTNNTNISGTLTYDRIENMMWLRGQVTWVGAGTTGRPQFLLPEGLSCSSSELRFQTQIITDNGNFNYVGSAAFNTTSAIFIEASGINGSAVIQTGSLPFTPNAGDSISINMLIPIAEWKSGELETKTIPLSSAIIVTQPDTNLRLQGGNGFGSTNTGVRRFTNILQNVGSAITYSSSSTLGDSFTINEDGLYTIKYEDQNNTSTVTEIYIVKNSTAVTTTSMIASGSLSGNVAALENISTGQIYLYKDDVIRCVSTSPANIVSASTYATVSISKAGVNKILNPSSNQKIDIPNSEVRYENANGRGAGAFADAIRFANISKLKGDGFTITSDSSVGTRITFTKAGNVNVTCTLMLPTSTYMIVYGNFANAVLSRDMSTAGQLSSISWSGSVKVGEYIYIGAGDAPTVHGDNSFHVNLQEQSIQVALSNVAPTWDNSDSAVRLYAGNGFGSTNTAVRRFANLVDNFGSAITYTDSSTAGAQFTINEPGLYMMSYTDQIGATGTNFGITRNDPTWTVTGATVLAIASANGAQSMDASTASAQIYLNKGDVIRCVSGNPSQHTIFQWARFAISKVGKTQGTVDVTPFVNTRIHENIIGEVIAFAGASIPENFLPCDGRAVSRTVYANLFAVIGTTHGQGDGSTTFNIPDYRGRFLRGIDGLAGNDPDKASRTAMNTGGATGNNVGSVQGDMYGSHTHIQDAHNHSQNAHSHGIATGNANANNVTNLSSTAARTQTNNTDSATATNNPATATNQNSGGNETRPKNAYVNFIIRYEKDQMGIATPTEQVSSDTMAFNFKATSIDPNTDPIGTYNWYLYSANTNTAVLQTSAPTQTSASMNSDGIRIYARAYNANGTAGQPNLVNIIIGKGLKSKQVDAYVNALKTSHTSYDYFVQSTTIEKGTFVHYNETTGVLTIDAGVCNQSSCTARFMDGYNTASSLFFVFNASKSPALVSIPNQNLKIAYVKDIKISTDGGTSLAAGWQQRNLNTLEDPNGIVTSLAANVFTLPAGTYDIEASAPAYKVSAHQIRLRSPGVTNLLGTDEFAGNADTVQTRSFMAGQITINTPTAFAIEHYTGVAVASAGLGVFSGAGEAYHVYTMVKITKIR